MKVKEYDFKVSLDDQDMLYRIYETGDFDSYLDKLNKFVNVEVCRERQLMSRPFYLYSYKLDSVKKKNVILDFGLRLYEYSGFLLAKNNFEASVVCQSFARKLLKSLI